jgi:hypothetical protein
MNKILYLLPLLAWVSFAKRMDHWELIPVVDHTTSHWCVVASWAMVLGYYDNYVPGIGGYLGYGRFIDHWREMPTGYNVPNLADDMIPGSGGGVVASGYQAVETKTMGDNATLWQAVKTEIDADRPCFLVVPGHVVVAFGYRIDNGAKKAIVYDPANPGTGTFETEYDMSRVESVGSVSISGGDPGQNLVLDRPHGTETTYFCSHAPVEMVWFVWGDLIRTSRISISQDGGNTWRVAKDGIATVGAWNEYSLVFGTSGTRIRFKVEGFDASNKLIAADGSFANVEVKDCPQGRGWTKIWGPTKEVLVHSTVENPDSYPDIYAVPENEDGIYRYDGAPDQWTKVGGPGKMFALDDSGKLYGLSPDGNAVFRYDGRPNQWIQIGGAAGAIYAGSDKLLATNPTSGDVFEYDGGWTRIGGPGKDFAIDRSGRIYGMSPSGPYHDIFEYMGTPDEWQHIAGDFQEMHVGGPALYATGDPDDIFDTWLYSSSPMVWTAFGGATKEVAVDDTGRLYTLSSKGVYRYDGTLDNPWAYTKIGGSAGKIFAGASGFVFATSPSTHDLWFYN